MRIDLLELENFRCFEHLRLALPAAPDRGGSFHLLAGANGTGKSSILEGLAIAVSTLFQRDKGFGPRRLTADDVRTVYIHHGSELIPTPQRPAVVHCEGTVLGERMSWGNWFGDMKWRPEWTAWNRSAKTKLAQLDEIFQSGADTTLPIVAYYGTRRLHVSKSFGSLEHLTPKPRQEAYVRAMDPGSNYKEILQWMKTQELDRAQFSRENPVLDTVYRAIAGCVPGCKDIRFHLKHDRVYATFEDGRVDTLEHLSDGFRTALTMVADIAIRIARINPALGSTALEKTPGLVLIDELDLHLHPVWQRRISHDLTRTFPLVQFVCTTHSPQIIGEVPREQIIILHNGKVGADAPVGYGADANWILEHVMGSSERSASVALRFRAIEDAIDAGQLGEARAKLVELEQEIGPNDGELTRLDAVISNTEALAREDD